MLKQNSLPKKRSAHTNDAIAEAVICAASICSNHRTWSLEGGKQCLKLIMPEQGPEKRIATQARLVS
jgi:hypothetical protein